MFRTMPQKLGRHCEWIDHIRNDFAQDRLSQRCRQFQVDIRTKAWGFSNRCFTFYRSDSDYLPLTLALVTDEYCRTYIIPPEEHPKFENRLLINLEMEGFNHDVSMILCRLDIVLVFFWQGEASSYLDSLAS